MKIYKYHVPLSVGPLHLAMPNGAQTLSFQAQGKELCLWALVDPDRSIDNLRQFVILATGENVERTESLRYVGTAQVLGDMANFVWHLFEIVEQ